MSFTGLLYIRSSLALKIRYDTSLQPLFFQNKETGKKYALEWNKECIHPDQAAN